MADVVLTIGAALFIIILCLLFAYAVGWIYDTLTTPKPPSAVTLGSLVELTRGRWRGLTGVILGIYPRRFLLWTWRDVSVRLPDSVWIENGAVIASGGRIVVRERDLTVLATPFQDPRNIVTVRDFDPNAGG